MSPFSPLNVTTSCLSHTLIEESSHPPNQIVFDTAPRDTCHVIIMLGEHAQRAGTLRLGVMHSACIGSMVGQRHRRWPIMEPMLAGWITSCWWQPRDSHISFQPYFIILKYLTRLLSTGFSWLCIPYTCLNIYSRILVCLGGDFLNQLSNNFSHFRKNNFLVFEYDYIKAYVKTASNSVSKCSAQSPDHFILVIATKYH